MEKMTGFFFSLGPVSQWIIFSLLAYSLLIFVLREFAVDWAQPRSENGSLRLKREGFVLKWLYCGNLLVKGSRNYPDNICQLYRGLWFGVLGVVAMCIIILIVTVVAFFFGYLPCWWDYSSENGFHKRERYGKNDEKKWVAPWKIVIPIVAVIYIKSILVATTFVAKTSVAIVFSLGMLYTVMFISAIAAIVTFALKLPAIKKHICNMAIWSLSGE